MELQIYGAAEEVTGSCFLLRAGGHRILVECGLIQGRPAHERLNREPFPFDPAEIDAVVLTHAHLDHSGRLPLLMSRGFSGPIYTHRATAELCAILLMDAAYLSQKDAEWENRRRERHGREKVKGRGKALRPAEPLYTTDEARRTRHLFRYLEYGAPVEILQGVSVTLRDAGHILGSAIAELEIRENGHTRRIVFSGDLGHSGAPLLRDPEPVKRADLVVMESTYGDRLHRPWPDTWKELGEIISGAATGQGNILIPAFAVGRSQELLYVFGRNFGQWGLAGWKIFLDSPMAIEATSVYSRNEQILDEAARDWSARHGGLFSLPNLRMSRSAEESAALNRIGSGAIIIAGSGMCNGGRIRHHLKHNVSRRQTHVLIVGFQAAGTLGRALVDGARRIRLWGETIQVNATIHTVGGLSAHADQAGLLRWFRAIAGKPKVALVHGEPAAMAPLAEQLQAGHADVVQARYGQVLKL